MFTADGRSCIDPSREDAAAPLMLDPTGACQLDRISHNVAYYKARAYKTHFRRCYMSLPLRHIGPCDVQGGAHLSEEVLNLRHRSGGQMKAEYMRFPVFTCLCGTTGLTSQRSGSGSHVCGGGIRARTGSALRHLPCDCLLHHAR